MQQSIETLALAWFKTLLIEQTINQAELKRLSHNFNILKVLLSNPTVTHRQILKRLNAPLYYYYYPTDNEPNDLLELSFNEAYQEHAGLLERRENGTTLQQKFRKTIEQPTTSISRAQAVVEFLKTVNLDTYTDAEGQSLHHEAFQLIKDNDPLLLKELRFIFYEFFLPSTLNKAIRESLRTFYKSKDTQQLVTFVGHETVGMLGDIGAKSIAEILSMPNNVHVLSLCKNNISTQGAQYLAEALSRNTTLQILDIQMNSIRNFGFASLITALCANRDTTIKGVNVSKNNITADFIEIMPDDNEIIPNGNFFNKLRLHAFYIGHNNLHGCEEYLANMMRTNTSLLELDLSNCQIDTQGGIYILDMIRGNTHLKLVNLSTNPLGNGIVQPLIEMLQANTTLQLLTLSHCELTDAVVQYANGALIMAFNQNQSLVNSDRDRSLNCVKYLK